MDLRNEWWRWASRSVAVAGLVGLTWFPVRAAPPRVAKAAPDNGAQDVDPDLKELRVVFDQPMSSGGHSVVGGGPKFPAIVGRPYWENDRTFIVKWRLQPEHEYWLSLNSGTFTNFRNREGESAQPYPIAFVTGKRRPGSASGSPSASALEANREAVEHLKRAIAEDYSYWDLRQVDWPKRFQEFNLSLRAAGSPRRFAELAAELLQPAQDIHLWLRVDQDTIPTYRRRAEWNVALNSLGKRVPGWRQHNETVATGTFEDGVRYVFFRSWPGSSPKDIEPAYALLGEAAEARKPLIVDVRANGGGAEPLAQEFAGCFVDNPVVYAKHVTRRAGQSSPPQERTLRPTAGRPKHRGPVTVLIGAGTVSSCESFALMMKQAPGCKLVGQRTAGASGNPQEIDLGNGVKVFVPSWRDLRLDGTCFEGEGIAPDLQVKTGAADFDQADPVIEAALKDLRAR